MPGKQFLTTINFFIATFEVFYHNTQNNPLSQRPIRTFLPQIFSHLQTLKLIRIYTFVEYINIHKLYYKNPIFGITFRRPAIRSFLALFTCSPQKIFEFVTSRSTPTKIRIIKGSLLKE